MNSPVTTTFTTNKQRTNYPERNNSNKSRSVLLHRLPEVTKLSPAQSPVKQKPPIAHHPAPAAPVQPRSKINDQTTTSRSKAARPVRAPDSQQTPSTRRANTPATAVNSASPTRPLTPQQQQYLAYTSTPVRRSEAPSTTTPITAPLTMATTHATAYKSPPYNGVRHTTMQCCRSNKKASMPYDEGPMEDFHISEQTRRQLTRSDFDTRNRSNPEMISLLSAMFEEFQLTNKFNIELPVLRTWLSEVFHNYNSVPFHNFQHCFVVTQMVFAVTNQLQIRDKLDHIDLLTLLVSAICHDLDHPGLNNTYQVNARTELAMRYNDLSPLENHHSATAFDIFDRASRRSDILRYLNPDEYKRFRSQVIRCILGTDMAKHNTILDSYRSIIGTFDFSDHQHKAVMLSILVKFADISNETRPQNVAAPWAESLYAEFFAQSELERKQGLPVAPFMDRNKVVRSQEQCVFMSNFLRPLLTAIDSHMPGKLDDIVKRVDDAILFFELEAIKDLSTAAGKSSSPAKSKGNTNCSHRTRTVEKLL